MSQTTARSTINSLGRLRSLGIQEAWQTALLLPSSWEDLTTQLSDYTHAWEHCGTDVPVCVSGVVPSPPQARFETGAPRLVGTVTDPNGAQIGFVLFGETEPHRKALAEATGNVVLRGKLAEHNGQLWLSASEIVDAAWAGKLRPRYPGKPRVISAETVRQKVVPELVEHIPTAAEWLVQACGLDKEELLQQLGEASTPIERILYLAHLPKNPHQGRRAQVIVEQIAALAMLNELHAQQASTGPIKVLDLTKWQAFSRRLPFTLTADQTRVICEVLADMTSGRRMRRILSGDVGSGKTAVFSVIAATVIAGGGRVAVLAPGDVLAEQTYRTILGWWPKAVDSLALVTGSTANTPAETSKPWLVGTTALLHRDMAEFDLVIVDEQQRFSRAQRETLVTANTHLLEVSATCIPRSLGLIKFGGHAVSHLPQAHVSKRITTRLARASDRVALFNHVRRLVQAGEKVLIVYPRREGTGEANQPVRDVASAAESWENIAPGRVRHASGANTDEENTEAVTALKEGSASVLIATTVVEVGIDIPDITMMIVVNPERYGLSALHQLRGRVARAGGDGEFVLYAPDPLTEKSTERLQVLIDETDGLKVAEADLQIRGFGDMAADGKDQSGGGKVLFGRALTPERVNEALRIRDRAQTTAGR